MKCFCGKTGINSQVFIHSWVSNLLRYWGGNCPILVHISGKVLRYFAIVIIHIVNECNYRKVIATFTPGNISLFGACIYESLATLQNIIPIILPDSH